MYTYIYIVLYALNQVLIFSKKPLSLSSRRYRRLKLLLIIVSGWTIYKNKFTVRVKYI